MLNTKLNIKENRKTNNYSLNEILLRIIWSFLKIFFSFTPRNFFSTRAFILRLMGAKVGRNVNIYSSAKIYFPWNLEIGDWSSIGENALIYNLGQITIGENTTISHNAHICAGTHDYLDPKLPLLKPPVRIKDQAWVAADAFIGPGVTIGQGAVVGARACVFKDVEPWTVVGGNPAIFLKTRKINEK